MGRRQQKLYQTLLLALVRLFLLCTCIDIYASDTLKLGILAKRGDQITMERWTPLAEYINSKTDDFSIELVPISFTETHEAVESQKIDFLLANSGIFIELAEKYGLRRIATLKNHPAKTTQTQFGGTVFTLANRDDIHSFDDLKKKRFAAVSENSLGGWIAAWREFDSNGIRPVKDFASLRFYYSHDEVVYALLDGNADAGTVRTDTLERMEAEGKIDRAMFRIIRPDNFYSSPLYSTDFPYSLSTRLYPEWPVAKLTHTDEKHAEEMAAILISMDANSNYAKAAKISGWAIPLNYQEVRDAFKQLQIGSYKEFGRVSFTTLFIRYWPVLAMIIGSLITLSSIIIFISSLNRRLRRSEARYRTLFEQSPETILVTNLDGIILDCNKEQTSVGYKRSQFIGRSLVELELFREYRKEVVKRFTELSNGDYRATELKVVNKAGDIEWLEAYPSQLIYNRSHKYLFIIRNITERKMIEKERESLLSEKEILLREVHHRIKNNMQTIQNLINLQSHNVKDEAAKKALHDAENRLSSMMLLYKNLYTNTDVKSVSSRIYIEQLLHEITETFAIPVAISSAIEDVALSVEIASALGMIINELVTNSMKYAFSKHSAPKLSIDLTTIGSAAKLSIRDNGSTDSAPVKEGFGLTLVRALTKQIGGSFEASFSKGAKCTITFTLS